MFPSYMAFGTVPEGFESERGRVVGGLHIASGWQDEYFDGCSLIFEVFIDFTRIRGLGKVGEGLHGAN